jgi:3-hydroxy acid dehydrogenase / malonic semialdehyde reductase
MTTALITGATSGIGRAIATALLARGHQVIAVGRNLKGLTDLTALGAEALPLDLTAPDAVARLSGLTPDILINNAGIMPPLTPFCDAAPDDIARTITTNLTAALTVTHAIAPGMRARQHGHIFFTGSTAGHAPFANLATYGATKAALGTFAQTLRLELAPHGVRVTEIVPGRVQTDLYRDALDDRARAALYDSGGAVQPADVAAMVCAVLDLPAHASVARFDIVPTYLPPPKG